jgi:hypothetical protein
LKPWRNFDGKDILEEKILDRSVKVMAFQDEE